MKLTPVQIRTLLAVDAGTVFQRYDRRPGSSRMAFHADGSYSWNTMRASCTLQTEILEQRGYIARGALVDKHGLRSRQWFTTDAGDDKIKEIRK